MPELEPAPYEATIGIDIHVNGVAKLLRGIKAHKANVVPIFKKGDHLKLAASNFRHVSLTSIASKVMEHIISDASSRHQ